MNQKQIGVIIVIFSIILASLVLVFKIREDTAIEKMITELGGSCYLSDGTCLHKDRDLLPYIIGWAIAASLLVFGMYLSMFDKTQEVLAAHQVKVTSALKEAKKKDEFTAFLSGFSQDEQKILKAIREQDGIKQSTLRYRTGMSKTTLSLMLKSLEERKIISRNKAGKTNEVFLRHRF